MREVNLKKTRSWVEISTTSVLPALCPISKDMVSLRSPEAFQGSFLCWSHNSPGTKPHVSHHSHLFPSCGNHNYCAVLLQGLCSPAPHSSAVLSDSSAIWEARWDHSHHCRDKELTSVYSSADLKVWEEWRFNSTDISGIFLLHFSYYFWMLRQQIGPRVLICWVRKCCFHIVTFQSSTALLSVAVSLFTVRLNPYPWWFLLIRADCQRWGQEWLPPMASWQGVCVQGTNAPFSGAAEILSQEQMARTKGWAYRFIRGLPLLPVPAFVSFGCHCQTVAIRARPALFLTGKWEPTPALDLCYSLDLSFGVQFCPCVPLQLPNKIFLMCVLLCPQKPPNTNT